MPATREKTGECRQCRSFCDKMVEPRGCVELGCRYLYSYVDRLTGVQYVGCMQGVFGAEVELAAVLQPGGFGGVKMTGGPLPHCQFSVERAYEGEAVRTSASTGASSTAPTAAPRACAPSTCATSASETPVSDSDTVRCRIRRMSDSSAVAEAEQVVAEATEGGAGAEGPRFTLELNQDQQDIRDWVHGFAEGVVRPPRPSGTSARRRPGR